MNEDERCMNELEIKSLVKRKVVEALECELEGEGVLKELWENCPTEGELALAVKALRILIRRINRGE